MPITVSGVRFVISIGLERHEGAEDKLDEQVFHLSKKK